MSYYDTIAEDLKRTREILASGAAVPGHGGIIIGADIFAAYHLLASLADEVERLQAEREHDPLKTMRAAKYLNPACAETGCQWLLRADEVKRLQSSLAVTSATVVEQQKEIERLRDVIVEAHARLDELKSDALDSHFEDAE